MLDALAGEGFNGGGDSDGFGLGSIYTQLTIRITSRYKQLTILRYNSHMGHSTRYFPYCKIPHTFLRPLNKTLIPLRIRAQLPHPILTPHIHNRLDIILVPAVLSHTITVFLRHAVKVFF